MDSWPGKLLVLLRLCLLGLFLSGGMVTLNNEVTHKRRDFVHRLLIAGTGWFAALPLVVLVASICAPYLREQVSILCRMEHYSVGTESSSDFYCMYWYSAGITFNQAFLLVLVSRWLTPCITIACTY
jgi:Rhodopsin-like GPCR transmembrane domain